MRKNSLLALLLMCACSLSAQSPTVKEYSTVVTGSERISDYLPLLKGKRVGIVTNASGRIGDKSLVDSLLKLKVNIKKVFSPEHGFRGEQEAGVLVSNSKDKMTGLPVVSLYGKNKKPTKEQLSNIDVIIYDIQDVGVRFYTYLSTLSYMMEACAEYNKKLFVFDRPNPNGFYIDGPVLKPELKSFLGLYPVPIVYGMTTCEYASMLNEEGWLANGKKCALTLVTMNGYDRNATYKLPVKPSPNIPNYTAVLLYPSLGLFEGTMMSLGRGTPFPFQVFGHPKYPDTSFSFVPRPGPISKTPRYVDQRCNGVDLRESNYPKAHPHKLNLTWLQQTYLAIQDTAFFEENFDYHTGNKELRTQIKDGRSEREIRVTWQSDLEKFKSIRKKYLLYADFRQD